MFTNRFILVLGVLSLLLVTVAVSYPRSNASFVADQGASDFYQRHPDWTWAVNDQKASIAPVYDSTGAMLEAINPKSSDMSIAPVYDATGAMLEAINAKDEQKALPLVYDSTSAMLDAINSKSADVRIAPVYDATGAMLDAINP